MSKTTITAKRLISLIPDVEKNVLILNFVNEDSKPERVPVSKNFGARFQSQKLNRDYSHNFTLYLDKPVAEGGKVIDFDKDPKIKNVAMIVEGTNEQPSQSQLKIILEKNLAGLLSVRKNFGIGSEIVQSIKEATADYIKKNGEVKAHDFISDTFFVSDVRENGKFIHIEISH